MCFNVGAIAKFSITMGITHQNKVAHRSHAWIHTLRSSTLIITIAFHRIEVGNSILWPNIRSMVTKVNKKTCWLNLYPIVNYGSYKSQFRIWLLWRPYFCKSSFTICTIHINSFVSRWFCEVVQWSINVFSHNSWNFVPWLVKILVRTPNLLSTLSKDAYVTPSLLWSNNGTNSNHLEKSSIITKTYWLCQGVKLNGSTKSKLHWYLSPIIVKGCN